MSRQRFDGKEELALIAIVKEQKRVDWGKVTKQLHEEGFPKRTAQSVRNRHLRWRQAQNGATRPHKNLCRKCGRPQRGHVCEVIDEKATSAEAES